MQRVRSAMRLYGLPTTASGKKRPRFFGKRWTLV
jgi:hypothetical protein